MTTEITKIDRPLSMTLISIFEVYSGFLGFYLIFQNRIQGLGLWNTLFLAVGGIVFFASGIGFWLMKKWAVYLYMVFGVIDLIILLVTGRWTILALLLPVIVIYFGYRHLSKMS